MNAPTSIYSCTDLFIKLVKKHKIKFVAVIIIMFVIYHY